MKLEDALKQNPYDKTRGSKGAYIRYLRYTVDGWYSKKSEEIRKQIDWDKITKESKRDMTREALKKLNEKQMNYCKTLSALIDRAKIKGLKEENERNRGKLRGFLEYMEQMELLSGYEVKALYLWFISGNRGE